MTYNIGLNVVEVDGSASPAIVGAATSIGAFNILTRRGVPNRPARITSFAQFVEQFGGYFSGGLGAYLVKGFFDNGGQTVYVNRVVATDVTTGASPARIELNDAANPALRLRGGFRGREDPGTWGNDLFARVTASNVAAQRVRETAAANVAATDIANTVDMVAANFPSLSVRVDGETNPTVITFQASDFATPTAATRAELRDAINRRSTKVVASIAGNHLVLTSSGEVARLRRDWTSLQVTAANATLGFTNMASPQRGTTAAIAATTTSVANPDAFQVGDAVRVADASDPARNGVVKIVRIVPTTGEIEWTPQLANAANYDEFQSTLVPVQFDLTIGLGGGQPENVVETWTGLSLEPDLPNYALRVLNDSLRGSRYVLASDLTPATPRRVLATLAFTRFPTAGRDGEPTPQDFIGDPATHTGFSAFDSYDVQLLACERTTPAVVTAALTYCANRGDCMFVGSVPEGFVGNGTAAVDYGKAFQGKKVYGAIYGPWIKIIDPIGSGANPVKWVPPTGHVMGVYARVETTRGIWKAPAGDEANLQGALDVEYRLSDAEHTDLVKNGSINGIRVVPGAGIVVDASRTLSTDTRWLYVNVRLLFNFVKSSLKQGLRWVRQEPNKDTLWNAIKFTSVNPFLMGLWRQGAFGTGSPDQVFRVIVDATNNPPDEVDKGNLKVEVYFYPSKPAETIVIIVGQMPSGATAAEG
ncbi:MAG: phage tail sheath family protein [Chloroflexi bacterium]|nr:phage tail sheath family protein [Chloroflexota bacterium]